MFSLKIGVNLRKQITRIKSIFPGWLVVTGASIALVASQGASGAPLGVLQRPMLDELGWSSTQYSLSATFSSLLGGVAGIIIGPFLDNFGARRLMFFGAVVIAFSFFGLSQMNSFIVFLILAALAGALGTTLAGPFVVNVTVAKWFVVNRGWALAFGSTGVSIGNMLWPVVMTNLVDTWGWRAGYFWLASIVFGLLVVSALLLRSKPEDYGLLPDGVSSQASDTLKTSDYLLVMVDSENSLTRGEALRTRSLWLISGAYGIHMAALVAVLMHGIPFMTDAGFSRNIAASAMAINGLANLCSKAPWAWGLSRFPVRYLAALTFVSSGAGVGLMLVATSCQSLPLLVLGFFFWGFGFGGTIPVGESIWADYYGRKYLGAVRGVGKPLTIILASLGPLLVGWSFDIYDSYRGAFFCLVMGYCFGAMMILNSPRPRLTRI